MKRSRQYGHWAFAASVVLLLIGMVLIPRLSQAELSSKQVIQRAWRCAQESGAYRFSTDIAQTTYPAPALVNVGRSSRQDLLHIEGRTNFPERTMLMTLWKGGGSLIGLRDGVEVRIEGDQAYGRQIGGVWQEVDDFSDAFAPGNDLMAYLAGAKNVRELGAETRSLTSSQGEISTTFTRYAFDVDGPAFAEHTRAQLEDYLREKGELPAGLSLDSSNVYRTMAGSGEVWIDSRGLPLRLTVHLAYPPQRNGERVEADIQTDFSHFASLAQSRNPLARLASALGLPHTPEGWREIGQRAVLATGFLGLLLLFLAYRKSRQVYAAFVVAIILSMLVTPLLQSHQVYAFSRRIAAQREEHERQQEEQDAAHEAADELLTSDWNPHSNSLKAASQRISESASQQVLNFWSPTSNLQAVTSDSDEPDPGSDEDGDGLTCAEENLLGTAPDNPDSDGDQICDDVEVKGFEYPAGSGKWWYSDPNNPDTNDDGIVDTHECWSAFPPAGSPPYTTPCDKDSDGDGIPDLFDRDDDGDGVSDRVDLSPARKMGSPTAPFDSDSAFDLQVNGLQADNPAFVDFQLRPTEASHLTFALNVLDWPSGDEAGQIQRHTGNNSTFEDAAIAQGKDPSPGDANGDMRLVPMLEITIPYDGGYGNLPVKPGAPATRGKEAEIESWLDKSKLEPYGISVRKKDNAGTLVVYVPLNIVADETGGGREAFSARMAYWPNSDAWGAAQQVRVVWLVMMLTDSCQPVPPGTSEAEAETWCDDVNNWVLDKQQPIHTYNEEWYLTGLAVREDHGLDVAVALEDPDGDADTRFDDNLWLLANGLEAAFISGRDQDGNDVRDVAIASQHGDSTIASRFDADQIAPGTTITDRWGIPLTATMQVENFSYPHQDYIAHIMMTETVNILNTYFATAGQPKADAPTLLFAREERYRSVNLDDQSLASVNNNALTISATPANAPEMTMAFLSWAPYRYCDGRWESYPFVEYWDLMEVRFKEAFPPGDSNDPDGVYEALGRVALARSYYLSMFSGVTGMVLIGGNRVWDLEQNQLDLSLVRLTWKVGKGVGIGLRTIVTKIAEEAIQVVPFFRKMGINNAATYCRYIGLSIKGVLQDAEGVLKKLSGVSKVKIGLAVAGAVLAVGAMIALAAQGKTAGQVIGTLLNIVSLGMAIKSIVQHGKVFLENLVRLAMGLKTIDTISKAGMKAGIIGLIVGAVVAFGAFIAMWVVSGVSFGSLAFNSMLAGVIATVVVSVIMFAIMLIPVVGQIIAAIIALIDSVIFTLCTAFGWSEGGAHVTPVSKWVCKGISGLMSEAIKWVIYSNTIMVDMEAQDRLDVQNFQQSVFDPTRGIAVGNALAMSAQITTTIGLVGIPIDWKAAAYFWQYSQGTLKSSTFEYEYQATAQDIHDNLSRGQLKTGPAAWESTDDKKVFIVRNVATDGSGVSLDEPGINHTVGLYLAEGYAIPAQECWAVPTYGGPPCPTWPCIPICYIRTEKVTNHIDLGQHLKYDIFPATLDGFYTPVHKNGGYSLAWGQNATITNTLGQPLTFPRQSDFDGDGLSNPADGGSDPDDSKWDTDGDGLSDYFESQVGSDPALSDTDGDGLSDAGEIRLGTNPRRQDSDSDGLTDLEEVNGWEFVYAFDAAGNPVSTWVTSDPLDADSDGDTLTDFQEKTYGFNPRAYSNPNVLRFESQVHEAVAPRLLLRFDEDAGATAFADSSGYDTPAVCAAASRPTAGVEGKYGHALRFRGPQPVQAEASISGSGPFAVAAWVKTNYHGHRYIVHQVTSSWSMAYSLEVLADGRVYWWTYGAGEHGGYSYGFQVISNQAIDDGNWHHLVGIREANGTGRIYVDGTLDNSASAPARDLAAGSVQVGPNFVGFIDEVAIFDRALSLAEVQQLEAGRYNPNDLFVQPGDVLDYQATVKNELYNRYAQGLLSTEFPGLLSDDVPPTSFVIQPQEEATMSGSVQVSVDAPSARMDLTQVAGALITDWREQSGFAEMWLRLDEPSGATTFADYSGAMPPRTGSCSGSGCPANQQPGAFGYALRFDGDNDHVTLPDAATLGLYDSSFTVSAWIKGDDFSGGDKAILGTDRARTNKGLLLGVHDAKPHIGFYNNSLNSGFTLSTGKWYHVVFRYDKTNGEMAIFVNGELKKSEEGHVAFQGQGAVYLGRSLSDRYFDGDIDDVRVFKRALTTDEIRTIYTQPVFEMHFEEPDGTMIFVDSSGSNSNGICMPFFSCPTGVSGVNGQAAQFDGSSYISIMPNEPLALNEGQFTLATWFYPASGDTHTQGILGRYQSYVSTDNPDPSKGDEDAYPTLLRIGRKLRFGFGTGSQWLHRDSEDVLHLDDWNHVVVTFGPTYDEYGSFDGNVATLYVNGARQNEWNLGSAAPTAATKQFFVGRATNKGRIYVDGINVTNENDGAGAAELCMAWNESEIYNEDGIGDDHGNGQWYDVDEHGTLENTGTLRMWEDDRDHTSRGVRCGSEPDDGDDALDGGTRDSGGWFFSTNSAGYDLTERDFSGDTEGTVKIRYQNPSIPFHGRIDELSLYKRALSTDDVEELYNAGVTGMHLRFDDAPGSTSFENSSGMANGFCASEGGGSGLACPTAGVTGRINQGVLFDGVNDYVEATLDVSEDAYAASLWFETECPDCGVFSVDKGVRGSQGHDRDIYLQGGDLCARVWSNETICTSDQDYADSRWHHVVHTFGSPPELDPHTLLRLEEGPDSDKPFVAQFYDNRTLSGNPIDTTYDYWPLNYDDQWDGMTNFSIRWQGDFYFAGDTYTFNARSDDGIRVKLDNTWIINDWSDHAARDYSVPRAVSRGKHTVTVEYYQHGGGAELKFSWAPLFRDASGNSHHATCSGSACPQSVSGKFGRALQFDGDDDHIVLGAALSGTGPFAVSAWIKTSAAANQVIIQQKSFLSTAGIYQLRVRSNGKVNWMIYHNGHPEFDITSNHTINDGNWHHVVGARESGGSGRIYIDGVLDGSQSSDPISLVPTFVYIGADMRNGSQFFDGLIDEVAIFNRAVTPEDVELLYAAHRLYVDGALMATGSKNTSNFTTQTGVNVGFANDAAYPYFSGAIDDARVFHRSLATSDVQALFHTAPQFDMRLDESAPTCAFYTEYYTNTAMSGAPAFTGCDSWPINHDWGSGGPANGVGTDDFAVRWSGDFYFEAGDYTFIARTNDGMRVSVDGNVIINHWDNHATHEYQVIRTLTAGVHHVEVEYREFIGDAVAQFYWKPFFRDYSGNENHGACDSAAACPAIGARGRVGLAPEFDGVDDTIAVPDDPALNFYDIYGAPFSVATWVKPTQTKNEYQMIIAKANGAGGDRNYALRIAPNSMRVQFGFDYRPMPSQDCIYAKEGLSEGSLLQNQWNYVVMTYEGSPAYQLKFYINGYLDKTIDTGLINYMCQNSDPLQIGGVLLDKFAGRVDEVTLYDRTLSPHEVRDNFLYQGKWVEDRQSHAVTVDADDPTTELRSVRTDAPDYRANRDVVMHVAAQDQTSGVALVELGVDGPGPGGYTWASAPRCTDASNGVAWCPTFDPTQLGGEGRYRLETRATDLVGHVSTSSQVTLYVDDTPPVTSLDAASGASLDAAPHPSAANAWLVHLSGTIRDSVLSSGDLGSGVLPDSVQVTLLAPNGAPAGAGTQAASLSGGDAGCRSTACAWALDYVLFGAEPSGAYTVTVEAADRIVQLPELDSDQVARHTASAQRSVYVDATPSVAHLDLAGIPTTTLTVTLSLNGDVTDRPVPVVVTWTTDDGGDEVGLAIQCLGQTLYALSAGTFAPGTTYTWDGLVHQGAACQIDLSDSAGDGGVSGTVQICGQQVTTWDGSYTSTRSVPFAANSAACGLSLAAGVDDVNTAFVPILPGSSFYNETPPAGELLHLPFEDNVDQNGNVTFRDISGQGHDGSCSGARCPAVGALGHSGNAARFDGQNDRVNLGHTPINQLTNDFTVLAWVKPDRVSASVQRVIGTSRWNSGDGFGFALRRAGLRFSTFGVQNYDTSHVTLLPGRWYHVAAVMHSDNSVTFYVDGEARETIAGSAPASPDSDDNLLIGLDAGRRNPFAGLIDEVRVLDHALTEAEIQALYLGAGPVLALPFDTAWATDGATLADISGWEHHGTLHTGADDPLNKTVLGPAGAYGLQFDGQDDYVSIAADAGLDTSGGRFTHVAWVYPAPEGNSVHPILSSAAYTGTRYGYPFLQIVNRAQLQVGFGDGSTADTFTTGDILTENAWNHVAATFDGTTCRVYVNGVERASTTQFDGRTPYPTQQFDIGRGVDAGAPLACATVNLAQFVPHLQWSQRYRVKFDGAVVYVTPEWPAPDETIPLDQSLAFCGSGQLEVERGVMVWAMGQFTWVSLGTHPIDTTLGAGSHTFADGWTSATLDWNVTADPASLSYFQGALDDMHLYPRVLSGLEIAALYQSRWQATTVTPSGADLAGWSGAPPAGLEGSYRLDLRGWDMAAHADNSVQGRGVWRGAVDTLAPRVTLTRTTVGSDYHYVAFAQDFNLTEDGFRSPCGAGFVTARTYFQSPWHAALSGQSPGTQRKLYQLTAECDTPIDLVAFQEAGAYHAPGVAHAVAVSGSHAYVAAGNSGLYVLDVSDPHAPLQAGSYRTVGRAIDLALAGQYAYLVTPNALLVIDVSDPLNPALAASLPMTDATGIAISGQYAYVADLGLKVVDISPPGSLALNGTLAWPLDQTHGVAAAGNYAYVADSAHGLRIVNVSNPASPSESGFYDTPTPAYAVALAGNYAYVADGISGLRVINISNPSSPTETGFYDTPGYAQGVALSDNSAYVADGGGGLLKVDVSTPAVPQFVDGYDTPGWAVDAAISGGYGYVADWHMGLRIVNLTGGTEQVTACDMAGNCTTAGFASATATGHSSPLTVSIVSLPPTLDSSTPISITGTAETVASTLRALTVTVDGSPIYITVWASGTVSSTTWSTTWTPSEGLHLVQATASNWDGDVASDTVTVTVDVHPPQIIITPTVLTSANYHDPRTFDLTGLVTDTSQTAGVQVTVEGYGMPYQASVNGNGWLAPWYLGQGPLPDGDPYTVTAQATDSVGLTARVTETVLADVVPPAPVTLALHSGGGVILLGDTVRAPSPTLTLTWSASSDGSGLSDYLTEWTAQTTGTVTSTVTAHDPLTRSAQYRAGNGQKVEVQLASQDIYGQQTWQSLGPIYADSPQTPDYVLLDDPDGIYLGWMGSGCTLVGVDRKVSRAGGAAGAALGDEQDLYVTWNAEALRLAWTGADWGSDGDLFVYLDVRAGGAITAFNPYLATMTDTVIYLPGATPLSHTGGMAADYLVWVRDSQSASLLEWDGSDWTFDTALPYRFAPGLNGGHTDLYLPFDLLGIADPASAALDMVAFASEEDALRLWAVMPNDSPVNSARVVGTPAYSSATQEFALNRRYHWDSLGDGVCPNGSYPDSDLEVRISAQPAGAAYNFLEDDLFGLWNPLLGNRPPDVSSFLGYNPSSLPWVGDGQHITYTIRYRNLGTYSATNVYADVTALYALRFSGGVTHQVVFLGEIGPGAEGTATFDGVVDTGASAIPWASVEAKIYDAAHTPAGPPLEWIWVDNQVDNVPPVFYGIRQPDYMIAAGDNTLYGYAYDYSGVPTLTMQVQGHSTLTCLDDTPGDGRWSCDWDTSTAHDGDVLDARLQAVDGLGHTSPWSDWQPFLVDGTPPTVTLDITVTSAISGGLFRDSAFDLSGDVSDEGGVAEVEVCLEDDCGQAGLLLSDAPAPVVYDDVPPAPIAIDGATTCGGAEIVRTFVVTDDFALAEVGLGFAAAHPRRDDVRVTLQSPGGTSVLVLFDDSISGTRFQNYDLRLNDTEVAGLDGLWGDHDPSVPYHEYQSRPYAPLQAFRGQSSSGDWTLRICDLNPSTDDGAYYRSRLELTPRHAASQSGSWYYGTPGGEQLDYVEQTIAVYGVDVVGNRSAAPTRLKVTIDNVAPVLTVTHVAQSVTFTPTARVLDGLVSDGGPAEEVTVYVETPAGDFYNDPAMQAGDAWHYDLHPVSIGTYRLWVNASDLAGNVTTAGPFEVEVLEPSVVFMPLVAKNYAPGADLVVKRIVATSDNVQVVIENVGDMPVTDEFWVDVYVAPATEPTAVNQTWDQLGSQGLVWGVTADALPALAPGGTFTLTLGDAYYWPSASYVNWPLAEETQIWAQVDSANAATDYGAVLENHEIAGREYNNITGPVDVVEHAASMAAPPNVGALSGRLSTRLPPRPRQNTGGTH